MATGHQLSMVTNSCVKPPVDRKTGIPSTLLERKQATLSNYPSGYIRDGVLYRKGNVCDGHHKRHELSQSVDLNGFGHTNGYTERYSVTDDMQGLSTDKYDDGVNDEDDLDDEDDYYQQLVKLKEEQKKTLALCEELYKEKLTGRSSSMSQHAPHIDTDRRSHLFRSSSAENLDDLERMFADSAVKSPHKSILKSRDNIRDMSSKPPTGKSFSGDHGSFSRVRAKSTSQSYDSDDFMKNLSSQSFDASEDDIEIINNNGYGATKYRSENPNDSNAGHIMDMWDNFSVDDYAPRSSMRQRSNSLGSSPTKRKESPVKKEWKHRITIPKPFKMTVRENAQSKKKSKAIEEFEIQRQMKQMAEEAECQKKFKAAPVPAHVYIPLYDEIMEEQELRRRQNKELAKELIRSMEKPFKFLKREEEKHYMKQTKSAPVTPEPTSKKTFKARPVPDYIYNDASILDKLQEEEEYRKIRVKMRSEELMRESSLPPNMKSRGRNYTDGKARQKMYLERAKKAGFTNEHKFRPKVNNDIPDFDELYHNFHNQLNRKKAEKEATVCKPFNLRTSRIPSRKEKIYEDIYNDELNLKESRWPFKTCRAKPAVGRSLEFTGSMSTSLDSIPAKMTNATELRSSANRERIMQQTKEELLLLEKERQRRQKERQLKKAITEKALANDNTFKYRHDYKEKMRKYRESERARQEEYRRELNEMRDRIESRPLLFERTAQTIAKEAAERKYKSKLQEAGLDEDFVEKQGSSAQDLDYDLDDYDSDDDYTANYSNSRSRSVNSDGDYTPVESDIDN